MHSISAFARRVGLTPSALRFYDDCGVLAPARVDPLTGYRYYSAEQEERAVLLRGLRAAGVPLADVAVVLDGTPEAARELLHAHAARLREQTDAAGAALAELLRALPPSGPVRTRLGGPELASAVRQVVPAAARDGAVPELRCVLIELAVTGTRLVATDRYRLAVRELKPLATDGEPRELLVPAPALIEAAAWATRRPEVTIEAGTGEARLVAGDDTAPLPLAEGSFPAYREVLRALGEPAHRVLVDRLALRDAVDAGSSPWVLDVRADELDAGGTTLPAVCAGPARLAFDPAVLGPALEAGVGPDVLLEITAADRPVVVRSADQGSFTTLVMPVAHP
ncbi:DNA polymerase III subunit beta family protein [Prauserella cavernicola]|uniref:MerR family transcriptional regulator n=1 Tax=Prauserella cavernicola TaxID=2800127 RepID=A0A934V2W1_9PSEU|nr:MerR family transcriptional regulator [Prauserella cavernicola]MBK1786521.1 MerR family transcriptional regulator [Prauserella cavernicola]